MSSIGGGGRRVGGPQGPLPPAPASAVERKDPTETATRQGPTPQQRDGFEGKAQGRELPRKGDMPPTQAPAPKPSEGEARFNELLKQARHDPKALANLINVLSQAYGKYAAEFSTERAKCETLLDKLAEQKFGKAALEGMRTELSAQREKAVAARQRMSTQRRRMRALKQLAGRVSDPKLLQEIAHLEEQLEGLQTSWAETYVGLGLGRAIYGDRDEDAPPHLRNVVKASVQGLKKGLGDAEQLGDVTAEMHPGRMVSRLAARQVTGEFRQATSKEVLDKVRGEAAGKHGRSMQAFAALYELFEAGDGDGGEST